MVVPIVTRKPWALVALILNLLPVPTGVGTLIAAANQEDKKLLKTGLIQFLLPLTFIGQPIAWIWAILTGVQIYRMSEPAEVDPEALAEAEAKREAAEKAKAEAAAAKEAQKRAKEEAKAAAKAKPDKPAKQKKPKKEKAGKKDAAADDAEAPTDDSEE